jgi:hypothetical protein
MIKVGDKIETWFSDQDDNMSTVLAVRPYTGRYTEFFNCELVLTAPRTKRGSIDMPYYDDEK